MMQHNGGWGGIETKRFDKKKRMNKRDKDDIKNQRNVGTVNAHNIKR